MDRNFHMTVNTSDRTVPLDRLSRGTTEDIYFALRMAAGEASVRLRAISCNPRRCFWHVR